MKYLYTVVIFLFFSSIIFSQDLYWINKNGGIFDDPANWSSVSGGNGGAGVPDDDTDVIFDENSGLEPDDVIVFEAGEDYAVSTFYVDMDSEPFTFDFQGTSSNNTTLTIFDDLLWEGPISTSFTELSFLSNQIIIHGYSEKHDIVTGGVNLNHFELKDLTGVYYQHSDLYASSFIRMYAGEWDTNGNEVHTDGSLRFSDGEPSNNQYSKIVITDGSEIFCEEFEAKFVYGSLQFLGDHTIHTNVFNGNPSQSNMPTVYDEVILLDYVPGVFSPIEDNNMDCSGCEFNTVTIEDEETTQIGGGIIIHTLNIENTNSIIQINGGNGREDFMILDEVNTPSIGSCNSMSTFEGIYNDYAIIEAINSAVTLYRVKLLNVNAGSSGTYTLSSGIVAGSSSGWNISNPIPPVDYYWRDGGNDSFWSNNENWVISQGQSTSCIPTLIDNVIIDNQSPEVMIVPSSSDAYCNNFSWIKDDDYLELSLFSDLIIKGDVYINKFAEFSENGSLVLIGSGQHTILSGSPLPTMILESKGADYNLLDDLECESLLFKGVNFYTNSHKVTADSWNVSNIDGNNFYLGNSSITVNGAFNVAQNNGVDQILDAGMSTITCESFQSRKNYEFHNLRLTNSSIYTFENWPFKFNKLDLTGSGSVTMNNDMEVNQLILEDEDAELRLGSSVELTVLDFVAGPESTSNIPAATITGTSSSNPATITKPNGNLCFKGHIDLENIVGMAEGVVHSPFGNDISNNTGINFTPFNTNQSVPLYWIGRTNSNLAIRSNWSTLSGGCSTNYTPTSTSRPSLIFDENSVYEDEEVVIYPTTTIKKLEFRNIVGEFVVDNRVSLTLTELELNSAYVKFIGSTYTANNKVNISNASVMVMEASTMISPFYEIETTNSNNLIIIRDGSQIIQQ